MAPSTPDPLKRRAILPWRASYDPALTVTAGEVVTLGHTDPDNPGRQWVENTQGLGGWIPQSILADDIVLEAFNSTELTVTEGDLVQILSIRQGWVCCRNLDGATGWLPAKCLTAD